MSLEIQILNSKNASDWLKNQVRVTLTMDISRLTSDIKTLTRVVKLEYEAENPSDWLKEQIQFAGKISMQNMLLDIQWLIAVVRERNETYAMNSVAASAKEESRENVDFSVTQIR